MRVFDIICVILVTKHLLPSDVSSMPTKYSTSKSHSLVSDDTHDVIRALRVSDESDTQERGVSGAFESIMKFIQRGPSDRTIQQIEDAKLDQVKEDLNLPYLHPTDVNTRFASLLMNEHFNRHLFIYCIKYDVNPERMKSLLLEHHVSNDMVKPIMKSYTKAYEAFTKWRRKVLDAEAAAMRVRKIKAAAMKVRKNQASVMNVDDAEAPVMEVNDVKAPVMEVNDAKSSVMERRKKNEPFLMEVSKSEPPYEKFSNIEEFVMKARKDEAEMVGKNVQRKMELTEDELNKLMNSLVTKDDYNWDGVKTLLVKNIHPDDFRKILWAYKKGGDEIDPILEFYTAMFRKYEVHPLKTTDPSQAAATIIEAAKNVVANRLETLRFATNLFYRMRF